VSNDKESRKTELISNLPCTPDNLELSPEKRIGKGEDIWVGCPSRRTQPFSMVPLCLPSCLFVFVSFCFWTFLLSYLCVCLSDCFTISLSFCRFVHAESVHICICPNTQTHTDIHIHTYTHTQAHIHTRMTQLSSDSDSRCVEKLQVDFLASRPTLRRFCPCIYKYHAYFHGSSTLYSYTCEHIFIHEYVYNIMCFYHYHTESGPPFKTKNEMYV